MKEKYLADYKCLKCNFSYKDKPGPTQCSICKNLYIKWINYQELAEKYFYPERKWYKEKEFIKE